MRKFKWGRAPALYRVVARRPKQMIFELRPGREEGDRHTEKREEWKETIYAKIPIMWCLWNRKEASGA